MSDADVVVIGGGHNGLVAAGYLARAGLRVRLLERLDRVGGATVSAQVFAGVPARLSRYSYLVSLLPPRILDDLGATLRLARRRESSYTPDPATGGRTGLLIGSDQDFFAVIRAMRPEYQNVPYIQGFLSAMLYAESARRTLAAGKEMSAANLKAALNSIENFDTGGLIGVPVTLRGNTIPVGRIYRADTKARRMVPASDWIVLE